MYRTTLKLSDYQPRVVHVNSDHEILAVDHPVATLLGDPVA
jgi:hypothetical protein